MYSVEGGISTGYLQDIGSIKDIMRVIHIKKIFHIFLCIEDDEHVFYEYKPFFGTSLDQKSKLF